jgi:hypothetical protein
MRELRARKAAAEKEAVEAAKPVASALKMLRLDGEIWIVEAGHDTDENSVNCRPANADRDAKAIAAGVTHIQTAYGGNAFHEVRQVS